MTHLPQFLQALDLGLDADERAVRRAYAKRLKQIDQAADPQGFQALRSIYESALQWVAMQRHEEAVAATTATLEPPRDEPAEHGEDVATGPLVEPAQGNVPEMPAALALGEQVYAEFAATAAGVFKDEDAARKALAQALSDARLVNLESRTFFEWRVACLIVEGWRPGLEYLFGPACSSFNWDQDRRRLALFGEVGGTLDAAINERLIFFRQDPRQFEEMRQTIRRLRSEERPEKRLLLAEIPRVELLIQRYPNWLRLVTSRTHIIQWRQWHEEIPLAERQKNETLIDPAPKQPRAKSGSSIPWWGICFGAFVVLKAIGGLMQPTVQHSVPQITSPPPVLATVPTPSADPRAQGRPLSTGIQESPDDPHVGNAPREPLRAATARPSSPPLTRPTVERSDGPAAGPATSRAQSETVSMLEPSPSQPMWIASAPAEAAEPLPRPKPLEHDTIGNVRFVKEDGFFVVDDVGSRSAGNYATLKAGDRLLACGSAYNARPLKEFADLRSCTTESLGKRDGETQYLYKVQRGSETTMSSVVVRY